MENVKYIPGDLVMTNGVPIGTAKGVVYRVVESKPNRTATFENGKVLKGAATLDNVDGSDFRKEGYLYCECSAWVKDIIPIPLTPEILEKNGWEKDELDVYVKRVGITFIFLSKLSNGDWSVCLSKSKLINCKHVHQLQHLLFGLGLPSDLKV